MINRSFARIINALVVSPLLLLACHQASPSKPTNILWIIGEDLGPEIAAYGTDHIRTPNIDRLAEEGVLFSSAFSTAPVCSPSRSAFMTGMYQTTIGAHNHRSHRDDGFSLPDSVKVITDWFRQAGYYTSNIRHLSDDPEEKFYRGTGKTDWNFNYEGEPYDGDTWSYLKANQPFYAQINFPETHRGGSWDRAHEVIEWSADPDSVAFPSYYPDDPVTRQVWAQYHNAIMSLDKKVGYVLSRLKEDEMDDNTIVIFMGDHGRAMVRGKQWPYDSGLHVPLIMKWPDGSGAGSVDDRLVSLIDVSASSLDFAGIQKPSSMQGRVLFGENRESDRAYAFSGRDRGDESVFRMRTARSDQYRYIYNFMPEQPFLELNRYKEASYPILQRMRVLHSEGKLEADEAILFADRMPEEELYDISVDPYEVNNLAGDPAYAEIKGELRAALENWIEESGDQGRIPESQEIHTFWDEHLKSNVGYRKVFKEIYGEPFPSFLKYDD